MAIQILRDVSADVVKRGSTRAIYAKQHDVNSRFLNVRIKEDGNDIQVNPNAVVMLNVERPDKLKDSFYGSVNEDGTVKVPLTSWMLELDGTLSCDISAVSTEPEEVKLTTMKFNIYVEEAVVSDGAIVETPEYSVIVDLLNRTSWAAEKAEKAAENATYLKESCEKATQDASKAAQRASELSDDLEGYKEFYQPKAGFIYPLASETVPEGFLLCDGAEHSRYDYPELFAAINTMYNPKDEDGTVIDDGVHFNVPNLQTRVPVGAGDAYELGQTGGEEKHKLTVEEMPGHQHSVWDTWSNLRLGISYGAEIEDLTGPNRGYNLISTSITSNSLTTTLEGNNQPHNNMQPYTVVNYIIATGKDTAVNTRDVILGMQAIPLEVRYGGTGATSAVRAREILGVPSKEYVNAITEPVLLWENSDVDSEQGEQTIVLGDVSAYSDYIVQTENSGQFRSKIDSWIHTGMTNAFVSGSQIYHRLVRLAADGSFYIGNCFQWDSRVGDSVLSNIDMVVCAVYGVLKKERALPAIPTYNGEVEEL